MCVMHVTNKGLFPTPYLKNEQELTFYNLDFLIVSSLNFIWVSDDLENSIILSNST